MRTRQNAAEPTEEAALTAEEQAALDAQRDAPEPEVGPAPPVQEAAETPQEGAGTQEGQEDAPGKPLPPVPYERFKEANDRRKEVERQAAEDRRKWEERFNHLLERVGQPQTPSAQPETPAIPDVQADPVGHIVGTMRQLGASQEQINQELVAYRQREQQAQAIAAVQQHAVASEAAYRSQAPDYDAAVDYLKQFRDRQLVAAGVTDPTRRNAIIMQEALQISAQAMQEGANPAERFYRLSEASGYTRQAQQAQQAEQAPDPAAQIQRIARGQEQARSLGNTRGNGPTPMTAQKLLEMSDAEFDKIKDSPQVRSLMGA